MSCWRRCQLARWAAQLRAAAGASIGGQLVRNLLAICRQAQHDHIAWTDLQACQVLSRLEER